MSEEITPESTPDENEPVAAESVDESGPVESKAAEAESIEDEDEAEIDSDSDLSPELLEELEALAAKVEASVNAEASAAEAEDSSPEKLLSERTADLQRVQAEYANYKKRVDRDRALARQAGIEAVIVSLLPVLDSVEAAREHEELVGGFKLVADEIEKVSAKYGLEIYGAVGEVFDPQIHEALMQMPADGETPEEPSIAMVMQRGVMLNGRVLRPARVGVTNPE